MPAENPRDYNAEVAEVEEQLAAFTASEEELPEGSDEEFEESDEALELEEDPEEEVPVRNVRRSRRPRPAPRIAEQTQAPQSTWKDAITLKRLGYTTVLLAALAAAEQGGEMNNARVSANEAVAVAAAEAKADAEAEARANAQVEKLIATFTGTGAQGKLEFSENMKKALGGTDTETVVSLVTQAQSAITNADNKPASGQTLTLDVLPGDTVVATFDATTAAAKVKAAILAAPGVADTRDEKTAVGLAAIQARIDLDNADANNLFTSLEFADAGSAARAEAIANIAKAFDTNTANDTDTEVKEAVDKGVAAKEKAAAAAARTAILAELARLNDNNDTNDGGIPTDVSNAFNDIAGAATTAAADEAVAAATAAATALGEIIAMPLADGPNHDKQLKALLDAAAYAMGLADRDPIIDVIDAQSEGDELLGDEDIQAIIAQLVFNHFADKVPFADMAKANGGSEKLNTAIEEGKYMEILQAYAASLSD